MGYETKLIIGKSGMSTQECAEDSNGNYIKDDDGELVRTGRTAIFFSDYAQINMCKCGHGSNIAAIDFKNKDGDVVWYWFGEDGNKPVKEDRYGESSKPISIGVVIEALKKDIQADEYRRFDWALALLESISKSEPEAEVLFYGY